MNIMLMEYALAHSVSYSNEPYILDLLPIRGVVMMERVIIFCPFFFNVNHLEIGTLYTCKGIIFGQLTSKVQCAPLLRMKNRRFCFCKSTYFVYIMYHC